MSRELQVKHFQKRCDHTCKLCFAEALEFQEARKGWFVNTDKTVKIAEQDRPVLVFGTRYFAGECLSMLNPSGSPGRVWSAKSISDLQDNIKYTLNQEQPDGH